MIELIFIIIGGMWLMFIIVGGLFWALDFIAGSFNPAFSQFEATDAVPLERIDEHRDHKLVS